MTTRVRETDGAVADAVRRMYAAYPDSAQFDRHLHPDITIWESDQPGPWIGLAELTALRDRRRADVVDAPSARLWVDDLLVDRWIEQAAVARYVLHADTPDGHSSFRVTDVLERDPSASTTGGDGWRIVHHHAEQV